LESQRRELKGTLVPAAQGIEGATELRALEDGLGRSVTRVPADDLWIHSAIELGDNKRHVS
jgi:hypothetical protein